MTRSHISADDLNGEPGQQTESGEENNNGSNGTEGKEQQGSSPFADLDLPEELKDKSPAEIVAAYGALKNTAKTFSDAFSRAQNQPPPVQPAQPQPPPRITEDDLTGDGASINDKFEAMFAAKAAPYVQQMMSGQAQIQYNEFFRSNPDMEPYRAEIDELSTQMTIEQAAQAESWNYVKSVIMSRHQDEIVQKAVDEKLAERDRRPAVPPTDLPGSSDTSPTGGVSLSPEERIVARGLGVTDAKFAEMKGYMNG